MKLLIIVNDFPNEDNSYGANIFVKEQLKAMQKFVDEINVVVPLPRGIELKRKTSYQNYSIGHRIHVHFVKYSNPLFPLAYSKLKGEWVWVESRAVSKFIKKKGIEFDLIHAHYSWPSGAVAVRLKEEFGVPVVITEHTSQTFRRFIEAKDPLIIETWRGADAIIRVRRGDIEEFKRAGVETPVFYIPNGFDGDKFVPINKKEARMRLDLPLDKKIVLNVANMYSEVKGHKYLITAFKKVSEKRDDVLLILVGDGKLRGKLESLAGRLLLKERVIFAGAKPHNEIPLWMNAADLFVLPSLSEGNPTVMFEALGVGLPFVGTAVGGVPEVITSEEYGLLCPPKDPECLAEKILIALGRKWDREKIRKYAEQFTWGKIAKRTLSVYNEVVLSQDNLLPEGTKFGPIYK